MTDTQTCNKCAIEKPLEAFAHARQNRLGRQYHCRDCQCAINRRFYAENRDRERERAEDWRVANPGKSAGSARAYYAAHREEILAGRKANASLHLVRAKKWRRNNPGKARASWSRRRAVAKQAVPVWADEAKSREVYDLAARLSKETGIPFEVDHVVPLQSKIVCGLHWHGNLAAVAMGANRSKSNSHWPDMPELRSAL